MRRVSGRLHDPLKNMFFCGTRYLSHQEAMDTLMSNARLEVAVHLMNGSCFRATIKPYGSRGPADMRGSGYSVQVPQEVAGAWMLIFSDVRSAGERCVHVPEGYERLLITSIKSVTIESMVVGGVVWSTSNVATDLSISMCHADLFEIVTTFDEVLLTDFYSVKYVEVVSPFEGGAAEPGMLLECSIPMLSNSRTFSQSDAVAHGDKFPIDVIGVMVFSNGQDASILLAPLGKETELLTATA